MQNHSLVNLWKTKVEDINHTIEKAHQLEIKLKSYSKLNHGLKFLHLMEEKVGFKLKM